MKRKTTSKRPAAKRGRPRKSTRKPASKSSFLDKYSWNIVGGIVAIFALLGLFQAGIVGKFMIKCDQNLCRRPVPAWTISCCHFRPCPCRLFPAA